MVLLLTLWVGAGIVATVIAAGTLSYWILSTHSTFTLAVMQASLCMRYS